MGVGGFSSHAYVLRGFYSHMYGIGWFLALFSHRTLIFVFSFTAIINIMPKCQNGIVDLIASFSNSTKIPMQTLWLS